MSSATTTRGSTRATGDSNFWTLPQLGYIDKNLTPWVTTRYQVRITDPNGNILWSPVSNTVTVSNGSPSAYSDTVSRRRRPASVAPW